MNGCIVEISYNLNLKKFYVCLFDIKNFIKKNRVNFRIFQGKKISEKIQEKILKKILNLEILPLESRSLVKGNFSFKYWTFQIFD